MSAKADAGGGSQSRAMAEKKRSRAAKEIETIF